MSFPVINYNHSLEQKQELKIALFFKPFLCIVLLVVLKYLIRHNEKSPFFTGICQYVSISGKCYRPLNVVPRASSTKPPSNSQKLIPDKP